jgi:hypothetical protein
MVFLERRLGDLRIAGLLIDLDLIWWRLGDRNAWHDFDGRWSVSLCHSCVVGISENWVMEDV